MERRELPQLRVAGPPSVRFLLAERELPDVGGGTEQVGQMGQRPSPLDDGSHPEGLGCRTQYRGKSLPRRYLQKQALQISRQALVIASAPHDETCELHGCAFRHLSSQ